MNAEKFVKNEAKSALSGNWGTAVFSVLVLLFVPIISAVIAEMSLAVLGDVDTVSEGLAGSPVRGGLFVLLNVAAIVAFVLMSPLYNGFVRVFSSIADGKKADPFDLFYFLETKEKYFGTLSFMVGVILKGLAITVLCEIIPICVFAFGGDNGIMYFAGVLLAIVGFFVAYCINHRFNFRIMLYSYYDYSAEAAARFGAQIAKNNTSSLVKLTGSFIPSILLTYFVVPFVYIYPYMTCSYMVSTKYLIENYKKKFGDYAETAQNSAPFGAAGAAADNRNGYYPAGNVNSQTFGTFNQPSDAGMKIPEQVQPVGDIVPETNFNIAEESSGVTELELDSEAKESVLLSYGDSSSEFGQSENYDSVPAEDVKQESGAEGESAVSLEKGSDL